MKKTIIIIISILISTFVPQKSNCEFNISGGILDLLHNTTITQKSKLINRIYKYGYQHQGIFGTCDGYFTLIQFYKPNYLVFSYLYTNQHKYKKYAPICNCDDNNKIIMVQIPKNMFEKWKNHNPTLIGRIEFFDLSRSKGIVPEWKINSDILNDFCNFYVVKDVFEVEKTNGSISIVPVIEPFWINKNITEPQLKKMITK